ncbi:hypothetical protein KJE20_02275 [Pyrenophora tritici-repentis]|uniref:Uncharacterized protein n=1 Tax=Pyrenophora tritici-repentis TaxID=45151 RepID=A0A922STV2_9PLEO|nr:hypothetical protein Ptr86124_003382 [Pyrenophora tritici-repentis]KAI1689097.1 hypothetical protein KJE20_02275 [Pyrenophora tritici-repentis]
MIQHAILVALHLANCSKVYDGRWASRKRLLFEIGKGQDLLLLKI